MPIKGIDALKDAASLSNTLAMASLAGKYLNGGFLADAMALIDKARKAENVHENIGHFMMAAAQAQENERELHARAVDRSQEQRRFLLRFADGYFVQTAKEPSHWRGLWSDGDKVQLRCQVDSTCDNLQGAWLEDDEELKLEGAIVNRGSLVKLYERELSYGNSEPRYTEQAHGFAYISADLQNLVLWLFRKRRWSDNIEQLLCVFAR